VGPYRALQGLYVELSGLIEPLRCFEMELRGFIGAPKRPYMELGLIEPFRSL